MLWEHNSRNTNVQVRFIGFTNHLEELYRAMREPKLYVALCMCISTHCNDVPGQHQKRLQKFDSKEIVLTVKKIIK